MQAARNVAAESPGRAVTMTKSQHEFMSAQELAGLCRALAIVETLMAQRCAPNSRAWSWDEGWMLGMEEVAYKLRWAISAARQLSW